MVSVVGSVQTEGKGGVLMAVRGVVRVMIEGVLADLGIGVIGDHNTGNRMNKRREFSSSLGRLLFRRCKSRIDEAYNGSKTMWRRYAYPSLVNACFSYSSLDIAKFSLVFPRVEMILGSRCWSTMRIHYQRIAAFLLDRYGGGGGV